MFQDASYAAHPTADTRFARADVSTPAPARPEFSWRHATTAGLLLLTLPAFAVAAVACLPVLLLVAAAQSLRRFWGLAFIDAQTQTRSRALRP